MSSLRALWVVWTNIQRNKRTFVLASIGLIVGVATFTFFVALGAGIQAGVLNKIYPVNQIELEPRTIGIVGIREQVVDANRLDADMVATFESLPDVTAVYPKLRSKLQARLWGGKAIFGYDARTEAFFDGLDPALLADELQSLERVDEKRARARLRRKVQCLKNEECPLGQECGDDGTCGDIEYWRRFAYHGIVIPCQGEGSTDYCPPGTACLAGECRAPCDDTGGCAKEGDSCGQVDPACTGDGCPGACMPGCKVDGDCPSTHACVGAEGGEGHCERLACELDRWEYQYSEKSQQRRGRVEGRCANGVAPDSPACEPVACPVGTYCAATSVGSKAGQCERPIPVILSPFLVEVFNSSAAASLGLQPLDGIDALLGVRFRIQLGDSYFTDDMPKDMQTVKWAEIAGFSNKALDFGVTMPIDYVRAINARFKGAESARIYDTFILETEGNEDVSALIADAEERGFTLSRKSQDARKAADLLFILTVVFSFISGVIMLVAAVNITHTFLTIITERRYEIGIMRAVGATRGDIRKLILGEASMLGLFGGAVGNLLSYGFSRLVNLAAARFLVGVPFKPEDFFAYDWRLVLGSMVFAWIFCIIGASLPAGRAARLDPAVVLTS